MQQSLHFGRFQQYGCMSPALQDANACRVPNARFINLESSTPAAMLSHTSLAVRGLQVCHPCDSSDSEQLQTTQRTLHIGIIRHCSRCEDSRYMKSLLLLYSRSLDERFLPHAQLRTSPPRNQAGQEGSCSIKPNLDLTHETSCRAYCS